MALHRQGNLDAAVTLYRGILAQSPADAEVLHWLGVAELQRGHATIAAEHLTRAVVLSPQQAVAHASLGNALRVLGRPEAALASYDRALALKAHYPEALVNRGTALRDLGRHAEALASFDRALELQPDSVAALFNRGNALQSLDRAQDALASYDRVLQLDPEHLSASINRGNVLHALQRYPQALACQERALAQSPQDAALLFNRGNTLRELERYHEALASYDEAIAVAPGHTDALNNRGNLLLDLKRYDEASASFAGVIARSPDFAAAHWNEAVVRLLLGDFERGWKEHEWRWRYEQLGQTRRAFEQPQWSGERVEGTLLAWGEQGLGDQILYLGMLPDLARRAGKLIVAVDARLIPLVARSFPDVAVVPLDRTLEEKACDAQIPLGSLGQYLRRSWADFPPRDAAAYLRWDPIRAQALRTRLAMPETLVCGISWTSASARTGRFKSLAPHELAPLIGLPGMRFVDLQYGDTERERRVFGPVLEHLDDVDNDRDIDGLAALIAACDVVVTVSNTTAHIAGAIGKTTLVMLPYSRGRHWYWHEDRGDSPWYPNMRLFRQSARNDWSEVIDNVSAALRDLRGYPAQDHRA